MKSFLKVTLICAFFFLPLNNVKASNPYAEYIMTEPNGTPFQKSVISADKSSVLANGSDVVNIAVGYYRYSGGSWQPGAGTTYYPQVSGSGNTFPASVNLPAGVATVTFQLKSTVAETKTITYKSDAYGEDNPVAGKVSIQVTFTSASSSKPKVTPTPASIKPTVPTITTLNNITPNTTSTMTIQSGQPIVLSGKTTPNLTVRLFIYSDPTQADVKADAKGDWTYTITQALTPGIHRVEAQTIDASGNASDKVELAQFTIGEEPASGAISNSLWFYIAGSIIFIILITVGVLLYLKRRKKPQTV